MKIEIPNNDNREFTFSDEHVEKIKKHLFSKEKLDEISQLFLKISEEKIWQKEDQVSLQEEVQKNQD